MHSLWQTTRALGRRYVALLAAHPLAAPLIAGALARAAAAVFALGFFARDDYFHVLEPALRWTADPSFDWDASDVPGAGIRSHLVPRAVWLLIQGLHTMGVVEPASVLRGLYLVLGLYSLLLVPAMFLTAHRLLEPRAAAVATWLAALHFVMPYTGTRLLIEAMAMPPLLFGVWLATSSSRGRLVLAGLMMSLGCWLRFQVGVAALGMAVVLMLGGRKEAGLKGALLRPALFAAGGVLGFAVQGLFDLATTGALFGPMIRNLQYNFDPPVEISRSTPFAYLGIWLLLTLPPASIVLIPAIVQAGRRLPLVAWPWLLFVLVHSAIPHKEERFMLPVLPLFLLLLAAAPGALRESEGRFWNALKRWWPATRAWLIGVHIAALPLLTTAQSQANLRDAMIALGRDPGVSSIVSLGPETQAYFLGRPELPIRRNGTVDAVWLARAASELGALGTRPNRFIAFAEDRVKVEILLNAMGLSCFEAEEISGWWLDRLVYRLNPHRNRRRSPVLIWRCDPPAVASVSPRALPRAAR